MGQGSARWPVASWESAPQSVKHPQWCEGLPPYGREDGVGSRGSMKVRWEALLIPPLVVSFLLFAIPQFVFLRMSLFADLGLGRTGSALALGNYLQFFRDPFYLHSLWLTTYLSA